VRPQPPSYIEVTLIEISYSWPVADTGLPNAKRITRTSKIDRSTAHGSPLKLPRRFKYIKDRYLGYQETMLSILPFRRPIYSTNDAIKTPNSPRFAC